MKITSPSGLPTNNERADWAMAALNTFAEITGLIRSGDHADDPTITLGDFLCNLRHLAAREGWDIEAKFQSSKQVFEEEQAEEKADESAGDSSGS
jgi:hypothetical protein